MKKNFTSIWGYICIVESIIFICFFSLMCGYVILAYPFFNESIEIRLVELFIFAWLFKDLGLGVLILLYHCLKIHTLKKNVPYTELLALLTRTRQKANNNKSSTIEEDVTIEKEIDVISQQEQLFQENLRVYTWFRTSSCQKMFQAFTGMILLILFMNFVYDSLLLLFFVTGLGVYGLIQWFKADLEVA